MYGSRVADPVRAIWLHDRAQTSCESHHILCHGGLVDADPCQRVDQISSYNFQLRSISDVALSWNSFTLQEKGVVGKVPFSGVDKETPLQVDLLL